VDPGVGTARRPIAIEVGGRTFVGPDNGLLSWALASPVAAPPRVTRPDIASGTLALAGGRPGVVLDRPAHWLPVVSASFHGRDLFGPVAARLSTGVAISEVGSPISSIAALPFPLPTSEANGVLGEIIQVDRFGNLISNLVAADLPPEPIVEVAGRTVVGLAGHFQVSAPLVAMLGSAGLLEVAVPNGSAAAALQVGVGERVLIRSARASATIPR
jgi:S-adenosylmethionine hydrolase